MMPMKIFKIPAYILMIAALNITSCTEKPDKTENMNWHLITLDPGHFHAALVQKFPLPNVDSTVRVYASEGEDLEQHLRRIDAFNQRDENPTHWKEEVYRGPDFLEKMTEEKAGNIVVISGNNKKKTQYIKQAIDAGFNVLADKPMVIDEENFSLLQEAFSSASEKKLLLYDIMTERYEITTLLQKELSLNAPLFGTLEEGTPENPSVVKESVHHFYKYVSGSVLTRPAWFMDVKQQGEGIVDVTTHLVDLTMWASFPEKILDYQKDVTLLGAKRWATPMTLSQFTAITKLADFPEYLKKDITHDTLLNVYANGEISYKLKNIHAKVSVTWAYQAPEGTSDTHYSIMRGTKANLVIRQGAKENYKPVLYIELIDPADQPYQQDFDKNVAGIMEKFPGVTFNKNEKGWEVVIPEHYKEGHEAHFSKVTEAYLDYLKKGALPEWEVPNMITKYYLTTQALKMALQSQ